MRRVLVVLGVATLVALPIAPAMAATTTVGLQADSFSPSRVTVSQGDIVSFVWKVGFHNVVFDDGPSSGAPTADAGTTFSRTFDQAGTFAFVCEVHESVGMVGTVTVRASAGSGNGETTTPTSPAPQGTGASDYPYTGPETSLLPGIGVVLVGAAAAWRVATRRRRR